jgi:predicted thioesterase
MTVETGASARLRMTVGPDDTAIALGSGDVPVLATPRLIAWCEAATVKAVADRLPPGETTVGARIEFDHLAPSPPGAEVVVSAAVTSVVGRRIEFEVEAEEGGRTVARGAIRRVAVDRQVFGGS